MLPSHLPLRALCLRGVSNGQPQGSWEDLKCYYESTLQTIKCYTCMQRDTNTIKLEAQSWLWCSLVMWSWAPPGTSLSLSFSERKERLQSWPYWVVMLTKVFHKWWSAVKVKVYCNCFLPLMNFSIDLMKIKEKNEALILNTMQDTEPFNTHFQ